MPEAASGKATGEHLRVKGRGTSRKRPAGMRTPRFSSRQRADENSRSTFYRGKLTLDREKEERTLKRTRTSVRPGLVEKV